MSNTQKITLEIAGIEVTAEVTFDYSPGCPAQTSGPVENCYPEESEEFEITSLKMYVTDTDAKPTDITSILECAEIEDAVIEMIQEAAARDCDEGI